MFLYKTSKPAISDIVLAKITEINSMNVVATLPDYNNLQAYISHTELSKKKRYKINKIVHIGKEIIVQVTGFNNEKNYAELSIRALNDSDIEEFNKEHRPRVALFNLWRYVYMKLNPEFNMDFSKINLDELNNFMNCTLWKIEEGLEAETNDDTVYEPKLDELYNNLISGKKNADLIKFVENYDHSLIKNILDSYASMKTVLVKQTKYQEFNAQTYGIDGLSDIKSALDCKTYSQYSELVEKYDIGILYLAGGKYSLTIKQKVPMEDDINIIYDYLIQEIKTRCESSNIVFSV
jgi:translation initiation factor 2 alpha subunit (eIF-2alpha)